MRIFCRAMAVLAIAVLGCQEGGDGGVGVLETELRPCKADSDCWPGAFCDPVACADLCQPDASGVCQPCGGASGICREEGTGPAPGTPADPSCAPSLLVDPAGCRDAAAWKDAAFLACASMGAFLTQVELGQPCGIGFGAAVATCCTGQDANEPVEPTPQCEKECDAAGQCVERCCDEGGYCRDNGSTPPDPTLHCEKYCDEAGNCLEKCCDPATGVCRGQGPVPQPGASCEKECDAAGQCVERCCDEGGYCRDNGSTTPDPTLHCEKYCDEAGNCLDKCCDPATGVCRGQGPVPQPGASCEKQCDAAGQCVERCCDEAGNCFEG